MNPNGVTTHKAEVPLSIGTSAFCYLNGNYQARKVAHRIDRNDTYVSFQASHIQIGNEVTGSKKAEPQVRDSALIITTCEEY